MSGKKGPESNLYISLTIIAIAIIGMFFFGKQFFPTGQTIQRPYTIMGNGNDLEKAFDNDETTAWIGDEGGYNKLYYAIIDTGDIRPVRGVNIVLGGGGQPINYRVTIQTGLDGIHWNEVIGAEETGHFLQNSEFGYDFLEQQARFVKVGIKLSGLTAQKMMAYEIKIK